MINAPGTIDADYRGEVQVPLINLGKAAYTIERAPELPKCLLLGSPGDDARSRSFDDTARGSGGFGHTG